MANKSKVKTKAKTKKIVKKAKIVKKVSKKIAKKIAKKVAKKAIKKTAKKVAAKKPIQKAVKKIVKKAAPKPKIATPVVKINFSQFVTPLDDRIFVRVTSADKVTAGGIYIPDTAQVSGNKKGEVLVVGRGHMNKKGRIRSLDVQKGEFVLFPEHVGTLIELQGQEVVCLRESEILAITTK